MQIIATQLSTREAPRKVRLVADAVRHLSVEAAVKQLVVVERKAGEVILKVLNSALANAGHNFNLTPAELSIVNIVVNEGPRFKRFQPVSRGRAHTIIKRTSHVTVTLAPTAELVRTKPKPELTTKPAPTDSTPKLTTQPEKTNKKTAKKEKKPAKV